MSLAATLVSFVLYYMTKAPTVSFWDCGEFIATSYIMGIPHPPGNPLYVIIGRFFTLLPIAKEIAVRVNLISVISSTASVFMAFWIILRLTLNNKTEFPAGLPRIAVGLGALAGSLIMGFSYTFWSNAVEAEVYGPAMLIMLIVTYLALLWSSHYGKPGNDRLLVLISFLLWLSLGIHMTTFVLTIPIVLYMAYVDYNKGGLQRWPVWILMSLFVLYAVPLQSQILELFGVDIRAWELESFFLIFGLALVGIIATLIASYFRGSDGVRIWSLALMVFVFGVIGYSTQAYIPIRAAQKPIINENDPSSWPHFKSFLERKQYGQESMIERMLKRRGSWQNQFVSHPDFGLLTLLGAQYSTSDIRLPIFEQKAVDRDPGVSFGFSMWVVYVIFFGLAGIIESFKRSGPDGAFVIFTLLLCTVGLVFYLNFSDGVHNKAIAPIAEVRDRDYFYTPGFMYFGIIIGVGLTSFLEWAGGLGSHINRGLRQFSRPILALAISSAIFLPFHTAAANFHRVNRSGNYIPWDYASNILQSCDRDAILFTNGDNDTFPLWFLQEVENVRKDVRVVNLSLLNTPWYIHQLKNQLGVPIKLTHAEIEQLLPLRIQGYDRIWRVQDEMVKQIITNCQADNWDAPVYFAMTVADDNKLGLEDHLILEGMVHRVVESSGKDRVNSAVGFKIFGNPANFRSIGDPHIFKDENDHRLISNYIAAMFQLVESYVAAGRTDTALAIAEAAIALRPSSSMWQAYAYLVKMYVYSDMPNKADSVIASLSPQQGEKVYLAVSQDLLMSKRFDLAAVTLEATLNRFPSSFAALNNLVVAYHQNGDSVAARPAVDRFRARNSNDPSLLRSVDELLKRLNAPSENLSEAR